MSAAAVAVAAAPAADAAVTPVGKPIQWAPCAGVPGWQCGTVRVPKDYADRSAGSFLVGVTRLPAKDRAHRIGSLFTNPGGPGASAVDFAQGNAALFTALNQRFDIVAFDPRGTEHTSQPIDCKVDQRRLGLSSQPFVTPENLDAADLIRRSQAYVDACLRNNPGVIPYTTTANVARDMDGLRRSVGDDKLTYLGFSYGTYLGATYEKLFPKRSRALVLDGAVNLDEYGNAPENTGFVQASAFERELGRFFQACAARQDFCTFDGADPWLTYDELVDAADEHPIPAGNLEPVDGDDIRLVSLIAMYSKFSWEFLAVALNQAAAGDATLFRQVTDALYACDPAGVCDPGNDRFLTISAADQRWPRDPRDFLRRGELSWQLFDHFWFNAGYSELPWGLLRVHPRGVYRGPFNLPQSAPTPLVIGTKYDPATPYRGVRASVRQLGNARLLTMLGDGHTAYGGNSSCIDAAVNAYLIDLKLPPAGTKCRQEVDAFPSAAAQAVRAAGARGLRFAGFGVAPGARR